MRAPATPLRPDPAITFKKSEVDLPDETMEQLSQDCQCQIDQDIVKEAIEEFTAKLEWLLTSHHWTLAEIDDEAYVRLDLRLLVLIDMWGNAGE